MLAGAGLETAVGLAGESLELKRQCGSSCWSYFTYFPSNAVSSTCLTYQIGIDNKIFTKHHLHYLIIVLSL